jgi:hypothetical protein
MEIRFEKTRCYCSVRHKTFGVSRGSLFYRLKTEPATALLVISLLAYGCPIQAIAARLDRTPWTMEELFNFKVPSPRWTPAQTSGATFSANIVTGRAMASLTTIY